MALFINGFKQLRNRKQHKTGQFRALGTSNFERRTPNREFVSGLRPYSSGVRCSMFSVRCFSTQPLNLFSRFAFFLV